MPVKLPATFMFQKSSISGKFILYHNDTAVLSFKNLLETAKYAGF